MSGFIKWHNDNNNVPSIAVEEKSEAELAAEIIGKIVKRRQELGISQRELEKLTGVRQEVICRIENMKNIPQLDTLLKLMKPLGLRLYVSRI